MLRNWMGTFLMFVVVSVASFFATMFFLNATKNTVIAHDVVTLQFGATLKSKLQKWCLACKAGKSHTKRALRVEFEVPDGVATIKALISGGSDDTGDKCVIASLHNPVGGELVSKKLCTSKGKTISALPTMIVGKHYLLISDQDTSLTGKHPGNGGKYQITLKK